MGYKRLRRIETRSVLSADGFSAGPAWRDAKAAQQCWSGQVRVRIGGGFERSCPARGKVMPIRIN